MCPFLPQAARPLLLLLILLSYSSRRSVAQSAPAVEQTLLAAETQQRYGIKPTAELSERIAPASARTLLLFREAGLAPREHQLTAPERRVIAAVFAALPPVYQQILRAHVRRISFLEEMPNSALTATLNFQEAYPVFDITVRAGVLQQTVSEWLSAKERTCFEGQDATWSVTVQAGSRAAFLYVFLHEATHVLDASLHLTPATLPNGRFRGSAQSNPFTTGIWQTRTRPVPRFQDSLLLHSVFRSGGRPVPIAQAPALYEALRRTPFASLYSLSSQHEDLAEYATLYYFTHQLNQPIRVVVAQPHHRLVRYKPMHSPLVRRRKATVAYLFGSTAAN